MRPVRMNPTKYVVWHCSATRPDWDGGAGDIDAMHRAKGWNGIGYHIVIRQSGVVELGEDLRNRGAHVLGYNNCSVGVCLVGGLDANGNPDGSTFTKEQHVTLFAVKAYLDAMYPGVEHVGHRDLSPDIDGDGEVEPFEWLKQCPVFSVKLTFEREEMCFATQDLPQKLKRKSKPSKSKVAVDVADEVVAKDSGDD